MASSILIFYLKLWQHWATFSKKKSVGQVAGPFFYHQAPKILSPPTPPSLSKNILIAKIKNIL
jgi:hypothetical protein